MASARDYLLRLALLAAGYTAAAYLSLFLIPAGGSGASIVWPPTAIGLAGLFLFGIDLWPALLLPFFLLLMAKGLPPPIAAGVSLGDTLEAIVGVLILERFGFQAMFNRLSDALVFGLAAVLAPLVSASFITASFHVFVRVPQTELLWLGLWIGHMVSLLSFGAFAMRWGYKPLFSRTPREWLELIPMFGIFVAFTFLTYWTPYNNVGTISLLYISIIPLIWAALRVAGPRGMTLMLALMALIGATGALWGWGPLAHAADQRQVLLSVQLIVGVLSLIFLLFTSIVEERKEAVIALRSNLSQLQAALEQIKYEDQAKSDFIAILAHELRNPLSPILSSLEIMRTNGISPENKLAVASMASNVHVMARLLDDLLDMSRISQKKFKLERVPVKLSTVLAQSLEMAAPYLNDRRHELSVTEPPEELWINGDPVRLAQILVNLLTNAAKYTDPGGRIELSLRRERGQALIEVRDNGIGIDPSRLRKVFEPFGATDNGARRMGGLHIGLSLAKRMAELHQGSLEAESFGAGRGSTFRVRLPLLPQPPLVATETSPRRSRFSREAVGRSKSLGALKLIIVDDNEAAADSLAQLLRVGGHEARVAYDAPQALALCQGYTPAVALLDIGLPTMDGYELARRMRERFGEELLLVALTGYGQSEDKEKARAAGFNEHLTKPVSIVDVERVLLELNGA